MAVNKTLELKLAKLGTPEAKADTLVVFATQKATAKGAPKGNAANATTKAKASPISPAATATLNHSGLQKRLSFPLEGTLTGKAKETTFFRELNFEDYRNVLVVGLGSKQDHESVRQAAATALKALTTNKIKNASILFDGIGGKDSTLLLRGLTEGFLLGSYKFEELKGLSKKDSKLSEGVKLNIVTARVADRALKTAFDQAVVLAETVNFSRRLGDMPANLMTPTILANTAAEAARGTKLKVTIWDKKRIEKENMGGLLGVSAGSDQEPRFIIMEYKGAAASNKPVVFVGKGLTFDCGGVSIKPSAGMEEMKYDMCGGANVIGTLLAIAKLGLKINAIGLVPSTENMINGSATKPGDVHTARNGKTFEINNTDAEGRLILADALAYASELNPEIIVDAATLTGAMVVALGNTHTGYFTRDAKLKDRVERAAATSGEWVWNMPLVDFHVDDMKGTYADLSNTSNSKGAGSATAAAFLEQFVGEGIPWAHFDVAGTAWHCGNRLSYCPAKGATGAMVRTFVEIARQFER